jgi:branched-chain amino acid transport system permease protein
LSELDTPEYEADAATMSTGRRAFVDLLAGRRAILIPIAVAIMLILFPLISGHDAYWILQLSLIAVFGLMVSGVNLSFGYAGEVQFGQLFMFALGAYLSTALATRETVQLIPLLIASGLAAALIGAVIALPAVRIGGWSLAMTSFFLVITIPAIAQLLSKYTGGLNGIPVPAPKLFGATVGQNGLFEVAIVMLIIWLTVFRNFVRSRYGVMLRTMRESTVLLSSLGFSPYRTKVMTYALGALPAGIAGCLYALISQFLVPTSFDLGIAIGIVAASVLGGVESIYGAVIGAAILQLGPQSSLTFAKYADIAYGAFLIVAAIVFRRGLGGIGNDLALKLRRRLGDASPALTSLAALPASDGEAEGGSRALRAAKDQLAIAKHEATGGALTVSGVSKSFGGVHALRDVTLTAVPGEVTALIGSNGSGKTTMLNAICGYITPDSGRIEFGDLGMDGRRSHSIARLGVGRTFQTPSMPEGVSVIDVVASARYASDRCTSLEAMLRLPRYFGARRRDGIAAMDALELVGCAELATRPASSLPLGSRRQVEVARAMCGGAKLLLLDEPASGLSEAEVERLGKVLETLAASGCTVVLIEHNFGFVTSVATTAHVLHLGELIASGPAATIGRDPRVIESYLGSFAPPDDAISVPGEATTPPQVHR